jgi:hypothetical protein
MSDAMEKDFLIEKVRETLRSAPEAQPDPRAVARVLSTVWAAPRPSGWRRLVDGWRMPVVSRMGALAMTGVALVVGGLLGREALAPADQPMDPVASMGSPTGEYPVQVASNTGAASGQRLVATQFILDDATAKRVSIVGDFNEWKPGATPLTRLANGVWTATVPLAEGRHVYAFVLDDTLLVADPRAPKAPDSDFGREGSVVMVFAP